MYMVDPAALMTFRNSLKPEQYEAFEAAVLYLHNMSCVDQVNPFAKSCIEVINNNFGVDSAMEPLNVAVITYGHLHEMLNCSETGLLLIDAEGHDCRILRSMIDYCTNKGLSLIHI